MAVVAAIDDEVFTLSAVPYRTRKHLGKCRRAAFGDLRGDFNDDLTSFAG
jgi:hypothetical protein